MDIQNVLNMKKEVFREVPVMEYLMDNLNLEGSPSKATIRRKIAELLADKELIVVRNSNNHSYTPGKRMVLEMDYLEKRMSLDADTATAAVILHRVGFVDLCPGGNNILASDMLIATDTPVEEYLMGLKLLRDVISFEIDFIESTPEDNRQEALSRVLLKLINSPMSLPNHMKLRTVLSEFNAETKRYKDKQNKYITMANSNILMNG